MNFKKSALVVAAMSVLAAVVLISFYLAQQSGSQSLQENIPMVKGLADLEKKVNGLRYHSSRMVTDSTYRDSLNRELKVSTNLLTKMLNGQGTEYGIFKLDPESPMRVSITDLSADFEKVKALVAKRKFFNEAGLGALKQQVRNEIESGLPEPEEGESPVEEDPEVVAARQAEINSQIEERFAARVAEQRAQLDSYNSTIDEEISLALSNLLTQSEALNKSFDPELFGGVKKMESNRNLYLIVLAVILIGIGFLLWWLSSGQEKFIKGLNSKIEAEDLVLNTNAEFADKIGRGELDTQFTPQSDEDVLGHALVNMRDNLKNVAEDDAKRNWATEGLAKFAEILRGNSEDMEALSFEIISNLVRYLKANQGGLFILDSDHNENGHVALEDSYLSLVACYAYERKKYMEKRIEIGEGLLGQSILEQDTIYMTDIPSAYINITSGLGESTPSSLLIVPLKVNDEIFGVVEIASFEVFGDHEIEFVEKLAESIASTISGVKVNVRTAKLLSESQKMTEEMRAQEEEMRQNMEELQATQDEMARKEAELSGQLSAINRTLATMEFDMNGMIQDANDIACEMSGYTLTEVKRLHHRALVPDQVKNGTLGSFWEKLNSGEPISGEYKITGKDKTERWMQASFTPVVDQSGTPYKVVMLANEITEQKKLALDFEGQLEAISQVNAIAEFDLQGNILDANQVFLTLMEYDLDELKNRNHKIFMDEKNFSEEEYKEFWSKLLDGEFIKDDFARVTKSGRKIWIQGSYNPILDMNGDPYKIVTFTTDITDSKRQEQQIAIQIEEMSAQEEEMRQNMEELQATQEEMERRQNELNTMNSRFELVNQGASEGLFDMEVPANGEINDETKIWWSAQFCSLLGYDPDKFPNRIVSWTEKVHPQDLEGVWKAFTDHLYDKSGEMPFNMEYRMKTSSGDYAWFHSRGTTMRDEEGNPIRVAGSLKDITEEKNKEEEINRIREEEKERTQSQLDAQKKVMEQFINKSRKTEEELRARIKELES